MKSPYRKIFTLFFIGVIVSLLLVGMLFEPRNKVILAQVATPTPCRTMPNACPANALVPIMGSEPSADNMAMTFSQQATNYNIPVSLLMAIGYNESAWNQFEALAGQMGCTVMPTTTGSCDYGLMQINWVHNSNYDFSRVAADYEYNITTGADILAGQWGYRPQINRGNQGQMIDWYNALWGYNSWADKNNPMNFPRGRIWGETDKSSFPYQEKILYTAQDAPEIEGLSRWNAIDEFAVPDDELFDEADTPLRDSLIFKVKANPSAFSFSCLATQTTFEYTLDTLQPVTTQITIYDRKPWTVGATIVKTLPSGVNWWDGTNNTGQMVTEGEYWFTVTVENSSNELIGLQSKPVWVGCQLSYLPLILKDNTHPPATPTPIP